jgi:hypothetical protein
MMTGSSSHSPWNRSRISKYLLLLAATALPHSISAQATTESTGPFGTLIIRNATIIDGTGGPARGPIDIVIRKNVIEKLLPGDPIGRERLGTPPSESANAHVIDARGCTSFPA